MSHKKVKTQPCLSPESPFMRKPSKEFLQKLAFNKQKPKQQGKNIAKSSQYFGQQNLSKLSFIPSGSTSNLHNLKNDAAKLKKTTIQLGTFKIKHENMLMKTQLQDMKIKNLKLMEQNQFLRKQNENLKKELQLHCQSRISKISQQTFQNTESDEIKRKNNFIHIGSQQSLLEIQNYQIMPTTMEISQVNSLVFEDQFKSCEQFNFLSTSINRKFKQSNHMQRPYLRKSVSNQQIEIDILSNRICYLQKQLQHSMLRQKALDNQNQSLRLCASMSKRRLQVKDSELKEIKIKQRKKKYFQKLFELSSEQENQYC